MEGPNKSAQAYDILEQLIIFQELAPGSMISEAELMLKTGVGRTPLREALQRLARDSLVEILPRRGVLVPPISVESQLKLLELRRPLEEMAARLAAQRATQDQRAKSSECAQLLEDMVGRNPEELEALLRSGHALIASGTQNPYIKTAMAPLQGLSRRFWFAHLRAEPDDVQTAKDLHAALLRAVASGEAESATRCARNLVEYLTDFAYASLETVSARD